ncbi:MAG: hypothetical protein GTO63_15890 [Anaerolineae bacterium]|nr:hypothetical protein [Anaerolineae bacterium]NIN96308.1 hypothetical protein [Anaerolineae bacterium]NIQ79328.1 hypothetical protein [Anaerolineae bacterium]
MSLSRPSRIQPFFSNEPFKIPLKDQPKTIQRGGWLYKPPKVCPLCTQPVWKNDPDYWFAKDTLWCDCPSCGTHFGIAGKWGTE